jgi:hypothetical protein
MRKKLTELSARHVSDPLEILMLEGQPQPRIIALLIRSCGDLSSVNKSLTDAANTLRARRLI